MIQRFTSTRFRSAGGSRFYKNGSAGLTIFGSAVGLIAAGAVAHAVVAQSQPDWLSSSVQKVNHTTLTSAIDWELPLSAANVSQSPQTNRVHNPFLQAADFLFGVDVTNPAALLGKNIPGIASLETDSQTVPDLPTPSNEPSQPADPTTPSQSPAGSGGQDSHSTEAPAAPPSNPLVYIYHTHSWESFLPDLNKPYLSAELAVDRKINITSVGAHLAADLTDAKVPTVQTSVDYWSGGYLKAYDHSRETVVKELKEYPSIQFVFDIHRDSDVRSVTTTTYHGQPIARVRWVIGTSNPNWKTNEKFAVVLNNTLNKLYPADPGQAPISRGEPLTKFYPIDSPDDSRYNQDLKPNDVLIEIGGPYNSLEECNRAADALANVIKTVASTMHLTGATQ